MINGSRTRNQGFTIIEVILFLAVSGLMMAGLLFAVGGGINQERYKDATNSFADFIKGQYNLVDNVQNARLLGDSGSPVGCSGERATTSCTIIGRFIQYDGDVVQSWPVIATKDIVEVLQNPLLDKSSAKKVYEAMNLQVPTAVETMNRDYSLRWQTRLVSPVSDAGTSGAPTRTFRMLLLRSPLTSIISTYYTTGIENPPVAANVINAPVVTNKVYLCVDPDGLSSEKTGISINTLGSNSSAIQGATPEECRV